MKKPHDDLEHDALAHAAAAQHHDHLGERNDGRLIRGQTAAEDGSIVKDTYARDDYLIGAMNADGGALVCFIAPNSWSVANGLGDSGAGSTLGWQGSFAGREGQSTVLGMLQRMTADNTSTTDEQAFANLTGLAPGPSGRIASAQLAVIPGDFYLPAWARFTVDPANFPQTAVQAEVNVSYAACPGAILNFTMTPTETVVS